MKRNADASQGPTIERWIAWLFAIGGLIVILDQVVFSLGELPLWHTWWNVGAGLTVAGILTLAVGGLILPLPALRGLWIGIPVLYIALQWTWVWGAREPRQTGIGPWIWGLEPAVLTLLLLSLRPITVLGASLLVSLLPAASSFVWLGAVPYAVLRETPIQLANVVYVAIFAGVYAQLLRLRAQESAAREEERREARAAAMAAEHARVSRVVHEEVLSAVAAAIHTEGVPPTVLKRAASGALAVLDKESDGRDTRGGRQASGS